MNDLCPHKSTFPSSLLLHFALSVELNSDVRAWNLPQTPRQQRQPPLHGAIFPSHFIILVGFSHQQTLPHNPRRLGETSDAAGHVNQSMYVYGMRLLALRPSSVNSSTERVDGAPLSSLRILKVSPIWHCWISGAPDHRVSDSQLSMKDRAVDMPLEPREPCIVSPRY